jgi:hypothetical protein
MVKKAETNPHDLNQTNNIVVSDKGIELERNCRIMSE